MLILLIISLIFIGLITYVLFKDILSPTFISASIFSLSAFIALLNYENWGVQYHLKTYFLIVGAVLFMFIGEQIGRKVVFKKRKNTYPQIIYNRIDLSFIKNLILIVLGLIFIYLSAKNTVALAISAGYTGGEQLLKYARWGSHSESTNHANFLTFYKYFITGIGYVYLYILIHNKVFGGGWNRKDIKYLPIILIFVIEILLSTSRADIILLIQMIIFMYIIAWSISKKWKKYSIGKFIIWGLVAVSLFLMIFQYLGTLTGKTGIYSNWETISIYAASSIPALDEWLNSSISNVRTFGKETFWGIVSLLNRFGLGIEPISLTKEFITFDNGSKTNIYTAVRHYYNDFGILGVYIIYLLKGLFLTKFYLYIKRISSFNVMVIIYSYFAYALVRQITASEFLSVYFTIYHMFTVLGIIIAYKIVIPNNFYAKEKVIH
jgi:oligosaccharide repeat unit polymerase